MCLMLSVPGPRRGAQKGEGAVEPGRSPLGVRRGMARPLRMGAAFSLERTFQTAEFVVD